MFYFEIYFSFLKNMDIPQTCVLLFHMGANFLEWTKNIKYFNDLYILEFSWVSCKREAMIGKEVTLMGSHNLYFI
jgi:hypothetical protein